jgi:ParB family chromosome partitioning protein
MHELAQYERVSLAKIREPAHQLRESIDPARLGELADSMSSEGLHQPIGVRGPTEDGSYEIVWGHRRFLAAKLLAWAAIPARVLPRDFDPLLAAVSENLQRDDLNPIEEARAIQKFVERGHPVVGIARLFRRSEAWVKDRLAMLTLPDDLIEAVSSKTLPLAVISVLRDIDHPAYRQSLIREAVAHGASAAVAEVWRAHYFADRARIIQNAETVEEIVSSRASFVITYPCEWCGELEPFERTTSFRLCHGCSGELRAAKQRQDGARS